MPVKKAFTHHLSSQEKGVTIWPKGLQISNSRHIDDYRTSHSFHIVILQDVEDLPRCADGRVCIGCGAFVINDDDDSLDPRRHKIDRSLAEKRQKFEQYNGRIHER